MPEYEPGGRSIGFTCSISLRLRRGDWIKVGTGVNQRIIGQVVKYKTVKNKTFKAQQTGEVDFYFDEGGTVPAGHFDTAKELIILSIVYGVVEKRGSWFYYNGEQLAQGTDKVIEYIRGNEELFNIVREQTLKVALASEMEREDVFGTNELTTEEQAELETPAVEVAGEDLSVPVVKGKGKKK